MPHGQRANLEREPLLTIPSFYAYQNAVRGEVRPTKQHYFCIVFGTLATLLNIPWQFVIGAKYAGRSGHHIIEMISSLPPPVFLSRSGSPHLDANHDDAPCQQEAPVWLENTRPQGTTKPNERQKMCHGFR